MLRHAGAGPTAPTERDHPYTPMAAERVGRHVRALEIEPRFVDVAIRRWQAFTRRDARHAESGLSFDEIAAESSRSGRFASRSEEAKE